MSNNDYLKSIINKYKSNVDFTGNYYRIELEKRIRHWAGNDLKEIKLSGSKAKGTAITLASDLDLFVSLSNYASNTLKDIFKSLANDLRKYYSNVREQNVSIRVTVNNYEIDVVPGKKQDSYSSNHSLYLNKRDSWTKTNIDEHIRIVKNSSRIDEIILTKVWREQHELTFPSIYIESIVIEALKYQNNNQLETNFLTVLKYLRDNIETATVIDPANSNNIISDDLSKSEKNEIKREAITAISAQYWRDVVW